MQQMTQRCTAGRHQSNMFSSHPVTHPAATQSLTQQVPSRCPAGAQQVPSRCPAATQSLTQQVPSRRSVKDSARCTNTRQACRGSCLSLSL
jgi:hypothetical protein